MGCPSQQWLSIFVPNFLECEVSVVERQRQPWNYRLPENRCVKIVPYWKYFDVACEAIFIPALAFFSQLLGSVVRFLAGNEPTPFSLSAPKGVYGILRRTAQGDLILWVCANVGSKDAAVGLMRQTFVPISNVDVRILIPNGRSVKSVQLLRAERSVPFTVSGSYVTTKIPVVHIAELVHMVLE